MHEQNEAVQALLKAATELVQNPAEDIVLTKIVDGVKYLGFDRVRLYLLSADRTRLVGRAQSGMDVTFTNLEWPLDIDLHTQALIQDPRPHVFGAGSNLPDRFRKLLGKTDATQWAEVPLVVKGEVVGKISVDNKFSGVAITEGELAPLNCFAQLASAAWQKARLCEDLCLQAHDLSAARAAEQERAARLEALTNAIVEIHRQASRMMLADRLKLIAKYVAEILGAESCGVLLQEREGSLTWVANWGHREGAFEPGREFAIRTGPGSGLTGHMAHEARLFNLYGDEILNHPARAGQSPDTSPSGHCHSILAVPLLLLGERSPGLVGLLRVTNKKNKDGAASPARQFSKEDESILLVFAEAAVAAIDNAKLVDSLRNEQQLQQQLIASSPYAIVAINERGDVTVFNCAAEHTLGYSAAEAIGVDVRRLYPPGEAERIGERLGQLRVEKQRLTSYETHAIHKDGSRIPIRLSASSWHNENGHRLGSVGYFKDLRPEMEARRRHELARRVVSAMAKAPNVRAALSELAGQVTRDLDGAWCEVLFSSEDLSRFDVVTSHPAASGTVRRGWHDPADNRAVSASADELNRLLNSGKPVEIGWAADEAGVEAGSSEAPGARTHLRPLLLVPIRSETSAHGLLAIGRQSPEKKFTPEEIACAAEIALQSTFAIRAMRWHHIATQQNERLRQVQYTAQKFAEAESPGQMRQIIADQARALFHADYATLWPYDKARDTLLAEELAASGIPSDMLERFRLNEPKHGHATYTVLRDGLLDVLDIGDDPVMEDAPKRDLIALGVKGYRGVRLTATGEPVGVLYLSYRAARSLPVSDVYLAQFVSDAALAIKKARLSESIERGKELAGLIARATTAGDLSKTLDAVTAGLQALLGSDIVAVYPCDSRLEPAGDLAHAAGLSADERSDLFEELRRGNLISQILSKEAPHVVDRVEDDPLFRNSRFAKIGVVSCVAQALKAADREGGVIFACFRKRYKLTPDELSILQLCADQAAVAIQNAELAREQERVHELETRRNADLKTLCRAGKILIETLEEGEGKILDQINETVVESMRVRLGHKLLLGTIQRYDANREALIFESIYPTRALDSVKMKLDLPLPITPAEGRRIGINGRAVRERGPKRVDDVRQDDDYLEFDSRTRSQISVPLIFREAVLGVLAVESDQVAAFDETDVATLVSLSELVVLAIHNARQFLQLRRTREATEKLVKLITPEEVEETQDRVAEAIQVATGCDAVTLYAQNPETGALDGPPSMIGVQRARMTPPDIFRPPAPGTVSNKSLVYEMLNWDSIYIVENLEADPRFRQKPFAQVERIVSCAAVPLRVGETRVGALFVNYRTAHHFTQDELADLELLGIQAAVVIRNAQVLRSLERRQSHLKAIQEAGKGIIAAFGADEDAVLDQIIRDVGRKFPSRAGNVVAIIQLGGRGDELVYKNAYPVEFREHLAQGFAGRKKAEEGLAHGGGIEARAVDQRMGQLVTEAAAEPDYVPNLFTTRSMIAAPLLSGGAAIGVLSVESERIADFGQEDLRTLEALAGLVVIAIRNSRQFAELKRVKLLVGTRTAMAYMGLMSAVWRHSIERNATTIRDNAVLICRDLANAATTAEIQVKLDRVVRCTKEILKRRPLAPLSSEPEAAPALLRATLETWADSWRQRLSSASVGFHLALDLLSEVTVRLSKEWLCQALDVLVRNAVDALESREERRISVACRCIDGTAEILVSDNGPGIPDEIRPKILLEVIPKAESARGFGTGLLLAGVIVEACNGKLSLADTGPDGTTMKIVLPVESCYPMVPKANETDPIRR